MLEPWRLEIVPIYSSLGNKSETPSQKKKKKKLKSARQRNVCTPIIIVALFTIAKLWNQPVYSAADE